MKSKPKTVSSCATSSRKHGLLSIILLVLTLQSTLATKHEFVAKLDRRFFIGPIGVPFGFLENGSFDMTVSSFSLKVKNKKRKAKEPRYSILTDLEGVHPGFMLKRFSTEAEFFRFQDSILESPKTCSFQEFLDEEDFPPLMLDVDGEGDGFTAVGPGVFDLGEDGVVLSMKNPDTMWEDNNPMLNHKFTENEAGYYFLFYQLCILPEFSQKFLLTEIKTTFLLDFEYKNYDMLGNVSYLTAGEMPLPHMFLYFSVSYALLLLLWVRGIKGSGGEATQNQPRPTIYAIHHLMSSVLLLKTLTIFFESVRYHFIRVHGHAELWSFVYYFLNFLKGTFLFTVILLIGSGWSFFKPFLSTKERRVAFFVMFLQVVDNIAIVVLNYETEGERLFNDWSAILHLVDIISCCAILIPIVWQVNTLEDSAVAEGTERDEADEKRLQSRLSLFKQFYLIVVGYIYYTRIVVYLFASSLPYDKTWLQYFISELGTLLFYFVVGVKFRPGVENSYSQVKNDEEVGAGSSSGGDNAVETLELELGPVGTNKMAD